MTISYKLLDNLGEEPINVQLLQDGQPKLNIPFFPGNRHYEQYLEWLAEGNTPLPADE